MPPLRHLPVLIWRILILPHFKRWKLISTMVSRNFSHDPYVGLTVRSEDQTNLHRLARHNAQEAIALAKQRAQDFDTQAALERKTNEALRLAKGQAHLLDEGDCIGGAPLVDCT